MSDREILEASTEVYAQVLRETGDIEEAERQAMAYFESLQGND